MPEHRSPIPAAQYVRMSTDRQEYSIENQKQIIRDYAYTHGFEIIQTYADSGKSGVVINVRPGLQQLMQDVVGSAVPYRAVLVYDISRWGRFQDIDEAAYYEFICRRNGVQIHYCAELFENNETVSSSLLKALKRTMAAEYSRELGVKVFEGKKRLALLGYRMGGNPGLGYRRKLVAADGRRSRLLKRGEHKSLTTDRVVLVLGPKQEVACVRKIFKLALANVRFTDIAAYMNAQGYKSAAGFPWTYESVSNLVKDPKYAGCNRWNRVTQRLHTGPKYLKADSWIVKLNAFPKIISYSDFNRLQELLRVRKMPPSKENLLVKLKRVLRRKMKLSETIISRERTLPSASTVARRCGDGHLYRAYQLIKYAPTRMSFKSHYRHLRARHLRMALIAQLKALFPGRITIRRLARNSRETLIIDGQLEVSLLCARPFRAESGKMKWIVRINDTERSLPTLVYFLSEKFDGIKATYMLPGINASFKKFHRIRTRDQLLYTGRKLAKLTQFCELARMIGSQMRS